MRFLDEHDVRAVFDLDTAIASQRAAFVALARGEAWQPEKILGGHPDDPDTVFCYAARLDRTTGPVCKFGSVNPGNTGTSSYGAHDVAYGRRERGRGRGAGEEGCRPSPVLGPAFRGGRTGRAGRGVQDAAAAWSVYRQADARGVGRSVDWPAMPAMSPDVAAPCTLHSRFGAPSSGILPRPHSRSH